MIWWATTDQDVEAVAFYEQHYSAYRYADGRDRWQFLGPGDKYALRSCPWEPITALWGWRKFIDDCIDWRSGERQQGVNCAVFRNESRVLSSECIREADAVADCLWADRRHYTYVDPKKVRSRNPGYCFLMAGWVRVPGFTKGGLIVLERIAEVGSHGNSVLTEASVPAQSEAQKSSFSSAAKDGQ